MNTKPPSFLPSHAPPSTTNPAKDKVVAAAGAMRDTELLVQQLTEQLERASRQLNEYRFEIIPDLMDEAGVDRIGLPPEGNLPACDLILGPYYTANIAASWPEEKRQAAFQELTAMGHEDLIKTELIVTLPRQEHDRAGSIIKALSELFQLTPRVRENVHPQTLTAWLKEQFEARNPLPPLDVIGGRISRIARLKERK